ncbi:MAG: drug/metabolite transporter (DMT)-like permease [Cyclobacteriaceae bacterium]|jgi:drug/metabolite transporter (DMT)-like permease
MSQGVRFMLFSALIFTLMQVCIKLIPHIPPIEIIFFRSVFSLVTSVIILKSQSVSVWGNNKTILILRGVSGAIALTSFFILIQQIPLAAASTLQHVSPIFSAILGIFILKEKVKWYQFLFFALSFAGIIFIQGFDSRVSFSQMLLGLGSAFFTGLAYNFVRKLKASEHPLVIIFYFPLVTLPLSAVYCLFDWVTPHGWDWLVLLLVGITTQLGQYFMTRSYETEEIAKVSILNYTGIIYSLAFGFFIFGESYNFLTYIGMFLVLIGVILNLWYKKIWPTK